METFQKRALILQHLVKCLNLVVQWGHGTKDGYFFVVFLIVNGHAWHTELVTKESHQFDSVWEVL